MRRFIFAGLVAALGFAASSASAAPGSVPGLDPVPRDLPTRCAPLAIAPTSARIPGPTLAAHVSVANCMAEAAMSSAGASGDDASIAKLDQAVAPSIAVLDSVIHVGDPYWKVVAEDAKRDIYQSMIVRERIAVPGGDTAGHAALEPKLARWKENESEAIAAIEQITRDNPMLAHRDPTIAAVIARAGELSRASQTAQREDSTRR